MSRNARDLLNAGAYIFALVALVGGLALGIGLVAERVVASAFTQAVVDSKGERPATRLSLLVDNAREIRAALAKPAPPRSALPPITAKLAYGHLKNDKSPPLRKFNISKAGLDAMASGAGASIDTRSAFSAPIELHRIY